MYFLHNEVDTIANMRDKLEKLVPEARIVIGHGQMNERELERVMRDFTQQKANLLLCTTIIETGIDNPRQHHPSSTAPEKLASPSSTSCGAASAVPPPGLRLPADPGRKAMTKQARQRLEAIQMMEELGSGFTSPCDLEIPRAARFWAKPVGRCRKSASISTPPCSTGPWPPKQG